ncbi:ABC transporter substrate-binding protein [Clostridium magnum]|uniref:Glutathione-binding protein GsiB n=1 Tax=Clostridium magnum DSM 2767 TaxID=1121326 RepID=A0A162QV23_9CLOT|nr:ABC transporter substrate-binding protein [Clostridium magnum]KZL89005.1 glutathione-binding protein GsiB precursor [Clostridium magnum DSM 2767]SHI23358.1 glutathione transport system substrate-binding protein [Clostridium magnum DSM 2767]
MKKYSYRKLFSMAIASVLTIFLAVGCGNKQSEGTNADGKNSSSSGSVQKADELVVGISADPSTLDPMVQSGQATRLIKMNLYRGLLAYQPDGKIGNEVAESYQVAEDNKTYTFKIKQNAKFHDGSDINAEDVKFSMERILDEKVGATFRSDFKNILDKCEVVDNKTVKIILKQPSAPFIDLLTLPESVIVSKAWCQSHNNDLNANPMGSGPYKFGKWDKGREITLSAFSDFYKKGKPETKGVRFVIIPDATTRANALKTGEVDLIDYVASKDVIAFEKEKGIKVDISEAPFMCLQINSKEGPLANPKVRQAIAYAVDRKSVITTAFMGRGTPIYGFPTRSGQNGYDGKYDNYFKFDQEKAKQLLTEAGYPNGFKVKILSSSTYDFHKQTALVIQDSLKKIGIDAEVELPDWSTRIERSNKGDYQILVSGTAGNIVDMDWCTNYFASGNPRMNSAAWFADEEVDKLLNEGRSTLDPAKRAEIYDKLRKRILDLSPFVFINYREQCFARKDTVEGFKNLDGILTYNSGISIENTYVRK